MTVAVYFVGYGIWLAVSGGVESVRWHLEKIDGEDAMLEFALGGILIGLLWPFAIVLGPLGYLGHKAIGKIVEYSQRPKAPLRFADNSIPLIDPDLADANREVEEICR